MPRVDFKRGSDIDSLYGLMLQVFLNGTKAGTKVSRHSVLGAIMQGVASVGQIAIKDVAIANTEFYIEDAVGRDLDEIAVSYGIAGRLGGVPATTFVRLVTTGVEDAEYAPELVFLSDEGIRFNLDEGVIIPRGKTYAYAKVVASVPGIVGNVPAFSINRIAGGVPTEHLAVSNEYAAGFGADEESDERFKQRIKNSFNNCAVGTLARIEEVLKVNYPNVLRIVHMGFDGTGNVLLGVVPVNSQRFNEEELSVMLSTIRPYLSLSDVIPNENRVIGTKLANIGYHYIDVDIRLSMEARTNIRDLQTAISIGFFREVDYRFWEWSPGRVEWDNLLDIVKGLPGVQYVLDERFSPRADIIVDYPLFPRFRSLIVRNLEGVVIGSSDLTEYYYPNNINASIGATV